MRPRVTLKWAQTLDGRVATQTGHSQWVTGIDARTRAHQLRAAHDAVLVGIGTVLADDPQLGTRYVTGRNPVRVVLDSRLRTPAHARLLDRTAPVFLATTAIEESEASARLSAHGARILRLPAAGSGVDVLALLDRLEEEGITSILVEGGPTVTTSFLRAGLAVSVAVFIAPKIVGAGMNAVGPLDIDAMDQALALHHVGVEQVGDDLLVSGQLLSAESGDPDGPSA